LNSPEEAYQFLPGNPASAGPPLFRQRILEEKRIHTEDCYQCQKCSAGCPVAFAMDYKPNQVVQMLSLGMKNLVLSSRTIWICASCYTCSTRCPNDIDIAGIMDLLRQNALQSGIVPAEKDVPLFHEAFLNSVHKNGRVHELFMIAHYRMKTGKFFDDLKLGWEMFKKGKLKFFPSRVKKIKEIRELFGGKDPYPK
jgi:heterodisulfide reductase subunit C